VKAESRVSGQKEPTQMWVSLGKIIPGFASVVGDIKPFVIGIGPSRCTWVRLLFSLQYAVMKFAQLQKIVVKVRHSTCMVTHLLPFGITRTRSLGATCLWWPEASHVRCCLPHLRLFCPYFPPVRCGSVDAGKNKPGLGHPAGQKSSPLSPGEAFLRGRKSTE
jgi:hypothetical protein